MSKSMAPRVAVAIALAIIAAPSEAVIVLNLNAKDHSPPGSWRSTCRQTIPPRFPGDYIAYAQPNGPLRASVARTTYYTTHPAFGGGGFFGADTTPGSVQTPTGNEPQFVLNGPDPGDFSVDLWFRRRGPRFGEAEYVFGMKSQNQDEQFIISLSQGGDDEDSIDVTMKDDDGAAITHFDQVSLPVRQFTDRFDHLVFTWDDSTSSMDIYVDGSQVVNDIMFPGVNLNPASVWNETVIFNRSADDPAGERRFNGDIARIRVFNETNDPFRYPTDANGKFPEPGTIVLAGTGASALLSRRRRSPKRAPGK